MAPNQMIELTGVCQCRAFAMSLGGVEFFQLREILYPGKRPGAEEVGFVSGGRYPLVSVNREATSHDAVRMIVFAQCLAPGMENSRDSQLRLEILSPKL